MNDFFKKHPEIKNKLQNYSPTKYEDLRIDLDNLALQVTKFAFTEKPYSSKLNDEKREGIYVDVTSGQPLFTSYEKYDAGCGWPSFTHPISEQILKQLKDTSSGTPRMEIKTILSDSHLGHVFEDGPKDRGGKRYCINGSALEFIPREEMVSRGYDYLLPLLDYKQKNSSV